MTFQPPKGTRDFLPDEMAQRRQACEKMRRVFEAYGYGEVCTPAFEDFEVLAAKSGPSIEEEIYAFNDKGGRKLGLRFDPTVGIARIVATDSSLPKPVKFYYITNMWRYDNPGAGRYREFWQAGIELIGPKSTDADAEVLAVLCDALKAAGVKSPKIRISCREILEKIALKSGVPKEKAIDSLRAIDKLDKIGVPGVVDEMVSKGIPKKAAEKMTNTIASNDIPADESKELEEIKSKAKKLGVKDVDIRMEIARGFDYYTGFVFEAYAEGSPGAIAGGGRYDKLIKIYGGPETPACGFGIGIDRIMTLVKENEKQGTTILVAAVNDEVREAASEICAKLRQAGLAAETDLMGRNLRKQFEYANAKKMGFAVVIGPKELAEKKVTVRDLESGKEESVALSSLTGFFASAKA